MFVTAHPALWAYGIVIAVIFLYLCLTYAVGLGGRSFDLKLHERLIAAWMDRSTDATVDIFLPICGEPNKVIWNTWEHVAALRNAHGQHVRVHVLDDRPTEAHRKNALAHGFEYITRDSNELKKAGNLRNAFRRTYSEFIVIFDADFCPRKDFLIETLPYMFEDPKCAIVQTPQFFESRSENNWIMNAAGAVQELFYRLIQVNRDSFGGAVCVGTNAVYRRSALAPFGGTAPMPYSEDVHTGFQCLISGWKIKYLPVILAEGICPDNLQAYFTQQYRWAMGSISLFFSKKFWSSKISIMQRACYLTGMLFYISTGIGIILAPIPTVVMLVFFPEEIHWFNLLFAVPSLLYGTVLMWVWMKTRFTLDVIRIRQVSYFAHLFALIDHLTGRVEEWKPTGGSVSSNRFQIFKPVAKIFWAASLLLIAGLTIWRISQGLDPRDFILVTWFNTFWAVILIPLIMELD